MSSLEKETVKNLSHLKMRKKLIKSKIHFKNKASNERRKNKDDKESEQNKQICQFHNDVEKKSNLLRDVEMCQSKEVVIDENLTSFDKISNDKKQRKKSKAISYQTIGLFVLQIISLIEILSIIGSIVVLNNNSTLLQRWFLLVILILSRVWKMVYFLLKKMFCGSLFCLFLIDYVAIFFKATNLKIRGQEKERKDKQEREESKIKSEQIEIRKKQYILNLHQDYDQKAIQKCQGKIKSISTYLNKETIEGFNELKTTIPIKKEQIEVIEKQVVQSNMNQILQCNEQKISKQQKGNNLRKYSTPTIFVGTSQDVLCNRQFNKIISYDIGLNFDSQFSSQAQDNFILSKQREHQLSSKTETIETDRIIIDCEKIKTECNKLNEDCKTMINNKNVIAKINEEKQKNTNLFNIDLAKQQQSNRNKDIKYKQSNSFYNFLDSMEEKIRNKVDSSFKTTKSIISFSEFNKVFENKLKNSILTEYEENCPDEDSEKYFFERKWTSINFRIIDGLTLSGPTLVLIAYWQSINCDGIDQKSRNIVNLSFWSCSICLALSICLLSSIQYIPLRNTAHALKKQIIGMIKEYLGLLACVVNSALSIAVGLQSNILIILIEILFFGSILYQIWNFLSDLQKNMIEEVKKKFYLFRILGIAVSPLILYLLLICSFQINFSSEFLEATLPQLLQKIPKLSLYELNRFSHKFQLIINIINKILLFYPIHSALLLIFDMLYSKVYMNFSLDNYINTQRIFAWSLWLVCLIRCIYQQFIYKTFMRKVGDKASEHENLLLNQLEKEYFAKYQLFKEKEYLQDEAHEKIKMCILEIAEFNQKMNEKEDQQKKLFSFLNKFGGETGNVMERKINNLQNATLSKIQLKLKISKLEQEKQKAEKYIIDSKENFTILQQTVENLAIKLQQLGIDTTLTQQTSK